MWGLMGGVEVPGLHLPKWVEIIIMTMLSLKKRLQPPLAYSCPLLPILFHVMAFPCYDIASPHQMESSSVDFPASRTV
jgi:hypothetical protein